MVAILKIYELIIYVDIYYAVNLFCKNELHSYTLAYVMNWISKNIFPNC